MRLHQRLSMIWWLTYANKSEKRSKRNGREATNDQEVIRKLLTSNITQNCVHFPDSAEKRPSRLHTRLMRFNSNLVSISLQPDINKFPSAHNREHGFRKFKSLQGSPNLSHHKLSRSTKDKPSPETFRLDSVSRFYKTTSTKIKQVQQHRPNVPTNPDRSCTYLVLRAHSDETSYE